MENSKELAKKYMTGYTWILLHGERKDTTPEKLIMVNDRLKEIETSLRGMGASEENVEKMISKCKTLVATPVGEMSIQELDFLGKVVFGQNTTVTEGPYKQPPLTVVQDSMI